MTGASKSPRQSTLPAPRGHPLPKEGGQSSALRSFLVLPTADPNSEAIRPWSAPRNLRRATKCASHARSLTAH